MNRLAAFAMSSDCRHAMLAGGPAAGRDCRGACDNCLKAMEGGGDDATVGLRGQSVPQECDVSEPISLALTMLQHPMEQQVRRTRRMTVNALQRSLLDALSKTLKTCQRQPGRPDALLLMPQVRAPMLECAPSCDEPCGTALHSRTSKLALDLWRTRCLCVDRANRERQTEPRSSN